MRPIRIDQLSRDEKRRIQRDLIDAGFLDPYLPGGDDADDGIWGPVTDAAYASYWASRQVEIRVPVVAPAPAEPWWISRGIWGALLVLAALPLRILAGIEYDPSELLDAVMPIVELIPLAMTAVGGLLAWWGRRDAQAPIDPTLVARVGGRDIRLPRLRRDAVPADVDRPRRDPRHGPFWE